MDPRSYVFPCSFQRIATERNDVHGPSDGGSLGGFGFEGEVTSFGGTLGRMNGVAAMANQPTPVYNPTNHVFFHCSTEDSEIYQKISVQRGLCVRV